jgi:hypothetical protein
MLATALFWIGVMVGIAIAWIGLALISEGDSEGLDFVAFGGCLISLCFVLHVVR